MSEGLDAIVSNEMMCVKVLYTASFYSNVRGRGYCYSHTSPPSIGPLFQTPSGWCDCVVVQASLKWTATCPLRAVSVSVNQTSLLMLLLFFSRHTPRYAVYFPLLLPLLLCFPYGVSSVLDIPFFLLPFFLEGLDCLFSCLILSLSTHLFILACSFPPLCWPLYRFLCSIV